MPAGAFAPASSAMVGMTSQKAQGRALTAPGLTRPGQRTIIGTRMPPSYSCVFSPRSEPLLRKNSKPFSSPECAPLSLVMKTTVLSSSLYSLSMPRMVPIYRSARVIMAA